MTETKSAFSNKLRGLFLESPVSTLTFFGLVLAISFNFGYFVGVGLKFMSLFPLQESIIFSLVGASTSIFALSIVQQITPVFDVLGRRPASRKESIARYVVLSLAVLGVCAVVGPIIYDYYFDREWGLIVACILVTITVIALTFFVHKFDYINSMKELVVFSAVCVAFVASCGLLYSQISMRGKYISETFTATFEDNRMAYVIRLGAQYSLITLGDGFVRAVRTETLTDIVSPTQFSIDSERRAPKLSPGAL